MQGLHEGELSPLLHLQESTTGRDDQEVQPRLRRCSEVSSDLGRRRAEAERQSFG